MHRLAAGLGAGDLPAVTELELGMHVGDAGAKSATHVGDAGASALAAALGRGALPRLQILSLGGAAIGDAGLVALAPALRRLPALVELFLSGNPVGDEGIAALVAPQLGSCCTRTSQRAHLRPEHVHAWWLQRRKALAPGSLSVDARTPGPRTTAPHT